MGFWAFFATSYADGAIVSSIPEGGPKANKYCKGQSLAASFPEIDNAVMCFDPNYPENIKLYDILECLDGVILVNKRAKDVFEKEGVRGEFLNVRLWDHHDRPVSDDYYIFNCLALVDFIDMEKSKVALNAFFPDRIKNIVHLRVKQDIGTSEKIFAPTNMTTQLFINDEFKQSLEEANITGFKLFQAEGWDGLPA